MKQVKQIAKTLTMMMISLDLNAISLSEYINVSHTPLNLIHTLTLVFNRVIWGWSKKISGLEKLVLISKIFLL